MWKSKAVKNTWYDQMFWKWPIYMLNMLLWILYINGFILSAVWVSLYTDFGCGKGSRKKSSLKLLLMAGPLRGRGGGGKGRPLRKKTFFGTFLKILLPFKDKNYFNLDNFSKYRHTLKFVTRNVYLVVTIFSKKGSILVQKLGEEKILSKSVSGYLKTKKKMSYGH